MRPFETLLRILQRYSVGGALCGGRDTSSDKLVTDFIREVLPALKPGESILDA